EPEMDVLRPEITQRRRLLEAKIKALEADLPHHFPPGEKLGKDDQRPLEVRRRERLEQKFKEWLEHEAARTVHWTVLRPAEAKANLPHLTVLADNSVFAGGDQSKRDVYNLKFHTDLHGITAIGLEVLPDDRLPGHGPGRVYYEGPFGDFFLSEFTVTAGGRKRKIAKAAHSYASGNSTAEKAIDGDPQTGWSINGGQGRAHTAVFTLAEPPFHPPHLRI